MMVQMQEGVLTVEGELLDDVFIALAVGDEQFSCAVAGGGGAELDGLLEVEPFSPLEGCFAGSHHPLRCVLRHPL